MKKTENLPDFKIIYGEKYPIIYRKEGSEYTDPCPFCGRAHRHGKVQGRRIAHCKEEASNGKIAHTQESYTLSDGTVVYQTNGYVLIDY